MTTQQAPAEQATTDDEPPADQRAEDVEYFRRALRNLVTTGEDFVCMLHVHAQSRMQAAVAAGDPIPAPENVDAVVSMSRCIRHNIALALKLAKPARAEPAPTPPENPHAAIRRLIIRAVDDAIGHNATGPKPESLREDLRERPEAPERDDEIDNRTIEELIADMRRQFARVATSGPEPWKFLTEEAIDRIFADAVAPSQTPPPARTNPPARPRPWHGTEPHPPDEESG